MATSTGTNAVANYLQRQYDMPHASSLRIKLRPITMFHYRHCANTIIFSSPGYDEDSERELFPSQLIEDITLDPSTPNTKGWSNYHLQLNYNRLN